jgi:hypothetical protein
MSIIPAVVVMAVSIGIGLVWFLLSGDIFDSYPYTFLLPWIIGLAVILSIPSVILFRKGRFTLADPLIFATWSYFFPAFVIGGIMFAFGWSQPSYLSFVQDVSHTLPLTIVLVAVGFLGLTIGYFLPLGERIGGKIALRLPAVNYPDGSYTASGVLLLLLGIMNTAIAFGLGLFGYQRNIEITQYDGIIHLTMLFWMQGSFLLWFLLFRRKKLELLLLPVMTLLVMTSFSKIVFAGSRGTILQIFTIIALAFVLSGRKVRMRHAFFGGSLLTLILVFGMIYGTTFRAVKGSETLEGVGSYTESVITTFSEIGRSDINQSLEFGLSSLAGRMDILTMLAVVVSNYEILKPYEEAYGLDNNIWVDTTSALIPRIVWRDKPSASDSRKYSALYFDFGESSFAITPIGDLLRNFGIVGVPLGMLILGVALRIIYRTLVENQKPVIWRLTLYFLLLVTVSYEGFFGTIIPNMVKVCVIGVIGILLINLIAAIITRYFKSVEQI